MRQLSSHLAWMTKQTGVSHSAGLECCTLGRTIDETVAAVLSYIIDELKVNISQASAGEEG